MIAMKNPRTGEVKEVKVGWSWILFLFSGFFGLPLFLRKLSVWGGVFLALSLANVVLSIAGDNNEAAAGMTVLLMLLGLGLSIFMGVKGNEMTAKNYLEQGWSFSDAEAEQTRIAKIKWGIAV
jgi:hypothetical protein